MRRILKKKNERHKVYYTHCKWNSLTHARQSSVDGVLAKTGALLRGHTHSQLGELQRFWKCEETKCHPSTSVLHTFHLSQVHARQTHSPSLLFPPALSKAQSPKWLGTLHTLSNLAHASGWSIFKKYPLPDDITTRHKLSGALQPSVRPSHLKERPLMSRWLTLWNIPWRVAA